MLLFLTECIVKFLAEALAFWEYFRGPDALWNIFDLSIVIASFALDGESDGGESLKVLRLVKLLRVARLVKKVPQLALIISGLIGGLKSIGYIMSLLVLVFYVYAIFGVMLFSEVDPWHFQELSRAMVSCGRKQKGGRGKRERSGREH